MRDDECPPENRPEHPVAVLGSKADVTAEADAGHTDRSGASLRNDLFPDRKLSWALKRANPSPVSN